MSLKNLMPPALYQGTAFSRATERSILVIQSGARTPVECRVCTRRGGGASDLLFFPLQRVFQQSVQSGRKDVEMGRAGAPAKTIQGLKASLYVSGGGPSKAGP